MPTRQTVFAQLTDFLPIDDFYACVHRFNGHHKMKSFSCWDQFLCMVFAQLTYHESLRDIESCLRARQTKLYHMGFRGKISRSTLAYVNEHRDWQIFADFAHLMIHRARELYIKESFEIKLDEAVYAFDSTTIKLCLSLFPWASFRPHQQKGAIKMHTLLDIRSHIPIFIVVTPGIVNDVKLLDQLIIEMGAIYVLDRGYIDFKRLHRINRTKAFFIIRAKINFSYKRLYSNPVDKSTGVVCDQIIVLTGVKVKTYYPEKLRRIRYVDPQTNKSYVYITNHFDLPSLTIVNLYVQRWQIELFFKWIKQHLRIKVFLGTSENAVKIQIWVAITVYVLIAIIKKQLKIDQELYTILQILSITPFEEVELYQLLTNNDYKNQTIPVSNQLSLFDL